MSETKMPDNPQVTPQPALHAPEETRRRYLRWSLAHRIEHWVFITSFLTLGLTGLVQKYATSPLSIAIVSWFGNVENVRIVHRVSATVMMISTVYHLGVVIYKVYVRRDRLTMLPTLEDARIAWQTLTYNLGLSKLAPQQGRYTFEEKLEYWAVVWGTVVMAVTGFMMWNPIATTRFLPGEWVVAAKAAHGGEALLAVLSIALWHMYHVIIRHFNRSMFTGYMTEEEMLHEHPLELADIKAGVAQRPLDEKAYRARLRKFIPTYGVIALVLLVGIYWFVTFEQTALATVPPRETAEVFVPLTPTPLPTPVPTRTPVPGGLTSWEGGFGALFQQRCGICHNPSARIGGLDLTSYEAALQGGNLGPALVPGEPDQSPLYTVQSAGGHAEQLSATELEQLREWIAAGAP